MRGGGEAREERGHWSGDDPMGPWATGPRIPIVGPVVSGSRYPDNGIRYSRNFIKRILHDAQDDARTLCNVTPAVHVIPICRSRGTLCKTS